MKELNGHSTAFPVSGDLIAMEHNGHFNGPWTPDYKGLTVRQDFAKHFMAALMVGTDTQKNDPDLAKRAVEAADYLINELNNDDDDENRT